MGIMKKTTIGLCIVYAFCGVAVACVDLRDYKEVDPTPAPAGITPQSSEPETINQAWRAVEDFRDGANKYIERRNEDIMKEEQKIAFIEGATSSGLAAVGEIAGQWAGPFAPLATLLIGYATKRRNDKTPEEYRKAKESSYNRGIAVGETLGKAAKEI